MYYSIRYPWVVCSAHWSILSAGAVVSHIANWYSVRTMHEENICTPFNSGTFCICMHHLPVRKINGTNGKWSEPNQEK